MGMKSKKHEKLKGTLEKKKEPSLKKGKKGDSLLKGRGKERVRTGLK